MPIRAALLYLDAKMSREIYITDMLYYAARATLAKPEALLRYADLVMPQQKIEHVDYGVSDVIDMFRGRGKLHAG